MKKIFMQLGILATLSVLSVSAYASQAYFDFGGVRHSGEVTLTIDNSVHRTCMLSYKGEIVLTDSTVLPVTAAFKICGWVGPRPILLNGQVILPNNQTAKLQFLTSPIDTNTDE